MMKRLRYIALAACALTLPSCATGYGRLGLLGGYSDSQIEPGYWRVSARTNGYSGQSSALYMALYRAAELARAAGYTHFQVVRSNVGALPLVAGNTVSFSGGGERASFRIRGARDGSPPTACEARQADTCRTFSVDEVIRTLGPTVNPRG